ncbi:hypothetical protein IV203_032473 [Nitzschia inconspicua]|uniref:Uncharacterized protein n=1 Tax=Nitzschia inconspicua TaxID=303405 RepID=A0A9K3KJP0_9STRA|nr:hypothetical protein IV203_032473 [Nitzschia inconspicua]
MSTNNKGSISSLNLGLLETFIPVSSIATVSVVVGFVLPRNQWFGLFLLVWWWLSVLISLSTTLADGDDKPDDYDDRGFLFASPSRWSSGDAWGMVVIVGGNAMVLCILYFWFHQKDCHLRRFFSQTIPLWGMIALNTYRLDGLSIIVPLYRGTIPTFIGFQTIVLDVWMGATAIPLAFLLHPKNLDTRRMVLTQQKLKQILWFWNSLGLYDLCSAFLIFLLNWAGVGGEWIVEPPLSRMGFHPFPLLILFQVPLAIAIHVLCLTHLDDLMDPFPSRRLPMYMRQT